MAATSNVQMKHLDETEVSIVQDSELASAWNITLKTDGQYNVSVTAEGYNTAKKSVNVSCDPSDCASCSVTLDMALKQSNCTELEAEGSSETCCDEDNMLRVEVKDSSTNALVADAQVIVVMKTAGNCREPQGTAEHMAVSPYLKCSQDNHTTKCGHDTITDEECMEANCCWSKTSGCMAKVGDETMKTDNAGLTPETPLPGHADYVITVTKTGFKSMEYEWTSTRLVDTINKTIHCGVRTVETVLQQEDLCRPEGVPLRLTVVDNITSAILQGVSISVSLTSSAVGASHGVVEKSLSTDQEGAVSLSLRVNGTYSVTAALQGYLDNSQAISLPAEVCTNGINVTIALTPTKPISECDPTTDGKPELSLTVMDNDSNQAVSGALVDITYKETPETMNTVGVGMMTNNEGNVIIQVSKLGVYMATFNQTSNSLYFEASVSTNLTCCSCTATLNMTLTQLRCPNPKILVTVKDKTSGKIVKDARIQLLLTGSETGPAMQEQGPIVQTNGSGLAYLNPTINGNYSVSVKADTYQDSEVPVVLACDPMKCEDCSLDLTVDLPEYFCSDRFFKLTVVDSTNNTKLTGASVSFVKESYQGPSSPGIFTVDINGEVDLPLDGNGHYSVALSHPGYIDMTTALQVAVSSDQCETAAPKELVAMSPILETGCVRLTLTWDAEPQDLDLYSYRVKKNQTKDQCLTYFCDGKDPCNGVDFDTDNKEGGLNGSETITYCGVDDYSNMVWVDDRSGHGSSLLNSQAKLVITAHSGQTQKVVLQPFEGQDPSSRYWLAGCLTTTSTAFSFLPLNQFTSGSPDLEQALHCHSRTQLQSLPNTPSAQVHVSVTTTKGLAIPNVLVKLESIQQTYLKVTGEDGKLVLPVNSGGSYSLLAQVDGYVPEQINFSLVCRREKQCTTSVWVTMMQLQEDNYLRIKLNWPGKSGRDLDLNLMGVMNNDPKTFCHTYKSNKGCEKAELDQNKGEQKSTNTSMSETMTVDIRSALRYLVYVEDKSLNGADLSQVQPQLTMALDKTFLTDQMPPLPSLHSGVGLWVAGAIEIVAGKFRYVAAKTWLQETPDNSKAVVTIKELLDQTEYSQTPAFCEGTSLVVGLKDALTGMAVTNATVDVIRVDGLHEQVGLRYCLLGNRCSGDRAINRA